jgi:hypothetical protein
MDDTTKSLLKMALILIIGIAIIGGFIWKANNPSDYRHPRDRAIKLH